MFSLLWRWPLFKEHMPTLGNEAPHILILRPQGRREGETRLTHLPDQTISHPANVSCPSSSTSDQVVHILPFRGDSDDTDVPSILLSEKLNQLADRHWSWPLNSPTLHCDTRGPPRCVSAYEISKSTGFQVDFGFQNGFLDFKVDFWISKWISGFQSGFLDFVGFLDFRLDFCRQCTRFLSWRTPRCDSLILFPVFSESHSLYISEKFFLTVILFLRLQCSLTVSNHAFFLSQW